MAAQRRPYSARPRANKSIGCLPSEIVERRLGRGNFVFINVPHANFRTPARTPCRKAFARAKVEISSLNCYNSSPSRVDTPAFAALQQEILAHAELARKVGTSRIRFQITRVPPTGVSWDDYLVGIWRTVGRALDAVPGVNAVVENHPDRANAEQLLATSEKVADERIGVELSPDHVLVMQEPLLDLIERYAPQIHHVCLADRKVVQADLARFDGRYYYVRYESCWIGDGIVPTERCCRR